MVYGTPFEQLEDEAKSAVSKKPKGIQDEIVTDERGRRRFHGAFTGGFSAGYFNTAGSKHGWVPQTFKSSRTDRGERLDQSAEDFMDDEDFGEFGIAARKFRTKADFMDTLAAPGEERLLAWERAGTSTNVVTNDDGSLANKLNSILRPVNDSIGMKILRKMGWRPGKGVGAKMTRRALERQKLIDAKNSGKEADFDEETVRDIEEIIPTAEFSPDDIKPLEICQKENVHGMGYKPLQEIGVLSETYGRVTATLKKVNQSGRGIRGQAFGVGAFEDDDEDIYTNYDLTQYDFEVGTSASQSTQLNIPKFDSTFIPSSTSKIDGRDSTKSMKFFTAQMPPSGWRPSTNRTKSLLVSGKKEISKKLPEAVLKASTQLTPFQRAKLLGERDHSVMEMLTIEQRTKLKFNEFIVSVNSRNENKQHYFNKQSSIIQSSTSQPFEEEPLKAHRFRQYVSYLKRGIPFIQPAEMTLLQWESEKIEFENVLPSELRVLLKEVQERQKPLAKLDFARPIAEHLKQRFARESGVDKEDYEEQIKHESSIKTDPQLEAVRSNQFGVATRQLHEWHPSPDLCKRFNVPNPYPDSHLLGVPGLSGQRYGTQKDYSSEYSLMELAGNLGGNKVDTQHRRHTSRFDQKIVNDEQQQFVSIVKKEVKETNEEKIGSQKNVVENAPIELLSAIFGDDDFKENDEFNKEEEEEEKEEEEESLIHLPKKKPKKDIKEEQNGKLINISKEKIITVLDIVDDDNVYGPAMPPPEFLEQKYSQEQFLLENKNGSNINDIITIESGIDDSSSDDDSTDSEEERRKRRKEKKRKKKMKKEKKKKHKKNNLKKHKH